MLHFAYSVRMVVGIGIYFRARGLSAGRMCMLSLIHIYIRRRAFAYDVRFGSLEQAQCHLDKVCDLSLIHI